MVVEAGFLLKSCGADGARVARLAEMHVPMMHDQLPFHLERLAALFTDVRPQLAVLTRHVVLQVAEVFELLAASGADVRAEVAVGPLVGVARAALRETLSARPTRVRPVAGMNAPVHHEIVRSAER